MKMILMVLGKNPQEIINALKDATNELEKFPTEFQQGMSSLLPNGDYWSRKTYKYSNIISTKNIKGL